MGSTVFINTSLKSGADIHAGQQTFARYFYRMSDTFFMLQDNVWCSSFINMVMTGPWPVPFIKVQDICPVPWFMDISRCLSVSMWGFRLATLDRFACSGFARGAYTHTDSPFILIFLWLCFCPFLSKKFWFFLETKKFYVFMRFGPRRSFYEKSSGVLQTKL